MIAERFRKRSKGQVLQSHISLPGAPREGRRGLKLFVAWCHCPRMGGATVGASYPVRQPHSRTISTMGLANDLEYELINTQS